MGLDGLEAFYAGYPRGAEPRPASRWPRATGLVVSAGSDYHGPGLPGSDGTGRGDAPALWRAFRDAS
ncbi:MAG: hypothetical protein MZW92_10070 [Comamonadaceae bacterium]|nr:hypothetical protein [Comamonadaceae bacterium]